MSACKVKWNNERLRAEAAAERKDIVDPSPGGEDPLALSIASNDTVITQSNTTDYTITGGKPPYSVSTNLGTITSASDSGTLDPNFYTGIASITVTDALNASAELNVSVVGKLHSGLAAKGGDLGRWGHSAVELAGKMYVFGGYVGSYLNDLWVFDPASGGSWTELTPSGLTPSARYGHSAVELAGKMYVFGGYIVSGSYLSDVWVFDPTSGGDGSWTELTPPDSAPSPRYGHSTVEIAGKMYVFGGADGNSDFSDVWVFDPASGGSWTELTPSGLTPSGRYGHSAVGISGKIYVFGGYYNSGSGRLNEVWVFDPASGGSWTELTPSGSPPNARLSHAAVEIAGKMFVFGGNDGSKLNEVWVFDPASGGSWTELTPSGSAPSGRQAHSAVEIEGKMYVFGGDDSSSASSSEIWVFDPASGGSWTELTLLAPSARFGHSAVELAGKIYVLGGYSDASGYLNDFWKFDPASGGSWTKLTPSGSAPSARQAHSAVEIEGKMYVFGGYGGGILNDVWVFDPASGGSWTELTPSTPAPSGRFGHSSVEIAGKIYVFGGFDGSGRFNEVWEFDPASGGAWTELTPSGSPPSGRYLHSAVEIAGKMYVFGGSDGSISFNEIWEFDPASGGAWTELTPSGSPPSERSGHSAVEIAGKMYVFGGNDDGLYVNDHWVFDPTSGGSWSQLMPLGAAPSARTLHSAVEIAGEMYVFGGAAGVNFNDVWVFDRAAASTGLWALTDYQRLLASFSVHVDKSMPIIVSGGVAPLVFSVDRGEVTSSGDLHIYSAPATAGSDSITVTDALNNTTTMTVNVVTALSISVPFSQITSASSLPYLISGGVPPYSVWAENGSAGTSSSTSGIYSAMGYAGADVLHVRDSHGNHSQATIMIDSSDLSISIEFQGVSLGSTRAYQVTGGTAPYTVTVTQGSVSSATGDGSLTPASAGLATLKVVDGAGKTATRAVKIFQQALALSVGSTNLVEGESTDYTVTGGSGDYSLDPGNGTIDNYSGTGIYSASYGETSGTLTVTDNITGATVSSTFSISP